MNSIPIERIVELRFQKRWSLQKIGDELGCTRENIRQRLLRAGFHPVRFVDTNPQKITLLELINNHDNDFISRKEMAQMVGITLPQLAGFTNHDKIVHKAWVARRRRRRDPARFFESHIDKNEGGCWVWTGPLTAAKHGRLPLAGEGWGSAPRWAYENYIGEIQEGFGIYHTCKNTICVNPAHLYAAETEILPVRTGTKLSYGKADEIRDQYDTGEYTYLQLAAMHDCSVTTIYKVINFITYK